MSTGARGKSFTSRPTRNTSWPQIEDLIWLTILTISRDVFIVSVALMLYLAYGHTKFRPSLLGKCCTAAELVTVGAVLLFNDLGRRHPLIDVAVWSTLGLTLASGFHYIWRTVRTVRAADAGRARV